MNDLQKDILKEIESIGVLLSIADESVTVQADKINRIGDLIVELCHNAL